MTDQAGETSLYRGPAFFSYGFRPFFFGAALFAGAAVPAWIFVLIQAGDSALFHTGRQWHVHEMIFGFLPAVITGFLLTAIPNWTDRPPIRGGELILLSSLWLAGRLVIVVPWPSPLLSAVVDGAFLGALAGLVWREIATAKSWGHAPIGGIITLYAAANIVFHALARSGGETDLAERMGLSLIMMLLAVIGGRITPNFTREFLGGRRLAKQPAPFSRFDGLSIAAVGIAALAWIVAPEGTATGWILVAAGIMNLSRLARWYGWMTWREPLVLMLHVGYGWLAISLLLLGAAILGVGLLPADAVHALTTGAVGAMTLAVMTRASLGHTGRERHAGPMTVALYTLVNIGALLRVFGPATDLPIHLMLGLAAACWSGAYLLFAVIYGPFLFRPSLDE
ncbi:MAG TPA: NnrS family protein [Nitrospiraceae bacterium]|nr:NnrS family protein [Nitrospiraceae bacterium]